ncbi:MAG: cysteine peptidase family C39 domain-containing protein, partial [archaeon]|nr:cysteine peptidase family C39 domain-containing protein [archaeon]
IIPWNSVQSYKFFNIDDIATASQYLKEYIELNHKLPNTIQINGSNISIISYAQLASEAILNINGDLYSLLIAKNFNEDLSDLNNESNSPESLENNNNLELNTSQIHSLEYIYLINQLNEYFNNNPQYKSTSSFNHDFNNAYIDLNNIYLDFNTMVYLISEVLSSYNHYNSLPNFLNLISFNHIKDNSTILFSQEDIINSSYYLKEYIYSNHNLPNTWVIANHSLNIAQVLDIYTSCIYNIDFNVYQSIPLREFNNSNLNTKSTTNSIPSSSSISSSIPTSYENIISGNLEYFEYISLIYDLKESFDEGKVVSNLSDLSLGDNIGFNSLLLMETLILNDYSSLINNSTNNCNLSSIEEITIIPWIVISNPDKVYNYRTNKVYDSIQEAIDDEDTLDKDYIGVAKSNIFESITINKTIYLAPVTNYIVKFISYNDNISNYGSVSKNNSNSAIIYLYSNSSIIEGFTFINSNKYSNSYDDYKEYDNYNAIEVIGSYNTISNCIFNDFDNGVVVRGLENYIGFNDFNSSSAIIYGNSTTFESNKINVDDYGIKLLNSDNSNILGNIIHSDIPIYISNSSANINFNSLISATSNPNGVNNVYINSNKHIDLNNNWWGLNNPDSFNYFDDFKSKNISCDSWLVLSLDTFVDYSTNSSGTHNTVLIGDLTHNNLNQDLSNEYVIDNLEMNFRTNYGTITDDLDNKGIFINNFDNSSSTLVLSYDGVAIANIYASEPSEAYVSLSLDNEIINKMIYLPSNTSYGVINNRSNKSYGSIQEAIDDNDTKNGDIIILKRGIFSENIFIYKNITLKSEDITYLNSVDDSKATITIFANGATIDNLFITGDEDSYAVYNIGVNTHLINCTLSDSMVGLYTIGSNNCSIDSCNFLNNEYGIYAHSTDNLKCFNCSFVDDSYGIYGFENSNITISNSKFEYCWISLDLVNMVDNTLIENTVITESYLGLELVNSNNICLINNLFSNNIVACSICNSTFKSDINSNINSTINFTINSTINPTINNKFVNNTLGDFAIFDDVNIVLQKDMWSCGPASLATVLHKLGYTNFNQNNIINYTNVGKEGTNLLSLLNYLHDNTVKNFSYAACLKVNSSELQDLDIVLLNISGDLHYSVIWDINEEWVILADSTAGMLNISRSSFDDLFSSYILVLDASNRKGIILTPQEASSIYGTWTVESAWTWLNTPCFEIPGYAQLDDNYGVLGQSIKLAGWFLLGIDDNGCITPLDLALDGLSVVSGFGIAERCGLSSATIIEKIIEKPLVNKFISHELYSIAKKGFTAYKTILSVLSNPVKYSISQISTKFIDLFEKNALTYFAKNYISNNFNTLASVLGITGSYDNLLNNTLLLAKISKLGGKDPLKDVIYNSKCTISSSLINTDIALKSIYKAYVSIGNKASNALKAIKKAVSSPANLKTALKYMDKKVKKKVKSSKIYKYVSKQLDKSKLGKTVKKQLKTAGKTLAKALVNTSKRIFNGMNYVVKKLKFW